MQNNINPSPKDFNLMVLGQIVSILGSAMLRFALSLYVLDITGRADIYATLFAISNVPLLLSPLGGAIADRFNRRNLMVIIDFSNSVIVFVLFLFLAAGSTSVVMIGIVMVLLSLISCMETPTVTACIPLLVEESKLEGANGIVSGVQALASVAAPVLGGLLYGVLGIKTLIIMSCAAFFLAAVMEIFIKVPFFKRELEENIVRTIGKDMKVGFSYVVKQPFIFKSMIVAALLNLLLTPFFVVGAPIILRMTMKSTDAMYGLGMGLIEFATILGALSLGLFAKKMKIKTLYRWFLMIAVLIIPIVLSVTPLVLGLGYYPSFILFIISAVPIAMSITIVSIFLITKVQKKTPNENLGKVIAIITAAAQCAAPIGQILYGLAFEVFALKVFLPTMFVCISMAAIGLVAKHILRNEEEAN